MIVTVDKLWWVFLSDNQVNKDINLLQDIM